MSDQQVKYTITADASQANSELAKVDKAAASLVNQERALADSTARATKAIAAEEKAAAGAAKAIADHGAESVKAAKAVAAHERAVEQSAKAMLAQQRATENLAAATKKAADQSAKAAGGSRSVGQAALEASRGIEDLQYGINGVVNNIPSLVMALGGGAGLTAAISISAVALNQLTNKLTDYIQKQQQASQAAIKGRLSLLDMRVSTMQETADLQLELDRLTAEISGGTNKVTEDASKKRLADLQSNITNAQEDIVKREGALQMLERIKFRSGAQDEQINATKAYIRDRRNRIDADNIAIEQEAKNQEIRVKIAKAEKQLADKGGASGVRKTEASSASTLPRFLSSEAGGAARARDAAIDADIANQRWTDALKAEADARKEQARMDAEATEESRRQAEERVKIAEDEASRKQDSAEKQASFVTSQLMQTSSLIAQSAVAAAKGQEEAGAMLLQGLAQQAGDLITLKGAESAATGIAQILTGNPGGAVALAGGLALIGAGQAISIGGAEVAASMIPGASRTPSTDKGASRDKGASPGRNSGGSGGGPLVVNVAYGAGGPLPEDTAREIQKAVDTGRRRGGR